MGLSPNIKQTTPPPAANPPTAADPTIAQVGAQSRARMRAASGQGFNGTITNEGGAAGLQQPVNTAQKSLLGA